MVEIWTKQGRSPEEAVRFSFEISSVAYVWEERGVAICMWGVAPIGPRNIAWLLTTDRVESNVRQFWKHSLRVVKELTVQFGKIEGYCDASFPQSVKWMKRLGFRLTPPGVAAGILLHHFEMGA